MVDSKIEQACRGVAIRFWNCRKIGGSVFSDVEMHHRVPEDNLAQINLFAHQRNDFQTNPKMVHLDERGRGCRLVATHRNSVGVSGEPSELECKILYADFCSHGVTCLLFDLGE